MLDKLDLPWRLTRSTARHTFRHVAKSGESYFRGSEAILFRALKGGKGNRKKEQEEKLKKKLTLRSNHEHQQTSMAHNGE